VPVFDDHADSYESSIETAIAFAGQKHDVYLEAKAQHLVELVERHVGSPADLRALDVGCGVGLVDRLLAGTFQSLDGVDVSQAVLERAAKENPWVHYVESNGDSLPFADGVFDVTFAMCVLHHVEAPERSAFARELARVTAPRGLVAVFEHNPLNPLTRLVVKRCRLDEGVQLIGGRACGRLLESAGLSPVESRYILLVPWRVAFWRAIETSFRSVPIGAQYFVAAMKEPR
jgi:SAM-dependent methyltransferase